MKKLTCPICNGKEITKKGYNRQGQQKHYCKDCKKSFVIKDSPIIKAKGKPIKKKVDKKRPKKCPFCGGTHINKKGFTDSGLQKYHCTKCNKRFVPGRIVEKEPKKECPYCHSTDTRKNGIADGVQRYQCNTCERLFNDNTEKNLKRIEQEEKIKKPCVHCGSLNVRVKHYRQQTINFHCKDCGKGFTYKNNIPFTRQIKKTITDKKVTSSKYTPEIIEKIKSMLEEGYYKKEIAEQLNLGVKSVESYTKGLSVNKEARMKRLGIPEKVKVVKERTIKPKSVKPKINLEEKRRLEQEKKELERKIALEKEARLEELKQKQEEEKRKLKQDIINGKKQYIENLKEQYEIRLGEYDVEIPQEFKNAFNRLSYNFINDIIKKDKLNVEFKDMLCKVEKYMSKLAQENLMFAQEKRIKSICKDIFYGISEENVIEKYNVTKKEMNEIINPLYEKEKLTSLQRQTIVKYGVRCNVPVDYIAPYIPCSIKKCNEVLSKYKIPKPKRNDITNRDLSFDKVWLEGFIR